MTKEELKQYIDENVYENQDGEITGESLNAVLKAIVDDGGTEVEANPTGEATETMQTIKIGETVYGIPQTNLPEGLLYGGEVYPETEITPDVNCYYIPASAGYYEPFDVTVHDYEKLPYLSYDAANDLWIVEYFDIYTYAYAHGKFDKVTELGEYTIQVTSAQEFTNAERLQALANVSNQEAGYESEVFTGKMGYVVLQPESNATASFAAQIANKPNTIFEIRDVFDLDNGSVTIPANCTLKFNGGMLQNGVVTWNNTLLDGKVNLQNITVASGNLANDIVFVDWFNPYGDGVHDDSNALVQVVKSVKQVGVRLVFGDNKTYLHGDGLTGENGTGNQYESLQYYNTSTWEIIEGVYSPDSGYFNKYNTHFGTSYQPSSYDLGRDIRLFFDSYVDLTIDGNGCSIVSNTNNGITTCNSILWLVGCKNVVVKDLKIDGKRAERFTTLGKQYSDYNSGHGYLDWHNIVVRGSENVTFENVVCDNSCHNGFDIKRDGMNYSIEPNKNVSLVNCSSNGCNKNNVGSNDCLGFIIQGGSYSNAGINGGMQPRALVDLEPESYAINNVKISDASFFQDLDKTDMIDNKIVVCADFVINNKVENADVSRCNFINALCRVIYGSKNVTIRECQFTNTLIWFYSKAASMQNCSFYYTSDWNEHNNTPVTRDVNSPLIAIKVAVEFRNNYVSWHTDLAETNDYIVFEGTKVIVGNIFDNITPNLTPASKAISIDTDKEVSGNVFNGLEVNSHKPVVLCRQYIDVGSNLFSNFNVHSSSYPYHSGSEFLSKQEYYITRRLNVDTTDNLLLIKGGNDFRLRFAIVFKENGIDNNIRIDFDSIEASGYGYYINRTTTSSNVVIKRYGYNYVVDFSNVTFASSPGRYIWLSIRYSSDIRGYLRNITNYGYNFQSSAPSGTSTTCVKLYKRGSFADKPSNSPSGSVPKGFQYFAEDINKLIVFNGTDWLTADGSPYNEGSVVDASAISSFAPNIQYNIGDVTSAKTITLAAGINSSINIWYFTFTKKSSGSITLPSTMPDGTTQIAWVGGQPVFTNDKYYEIMIANGVGTYIEV